MTQKNQIFIATDMFDDITRFNTSPLLVSPTHTISKIYYLDNPVYYWTNIQKKCSAKVDFSAKKF